MSSRISNSRKIPGPKNRELGGNTVIIILAFGVKNFLRKFHSLQGPCRQFEVGGA